MQEDGNHRADDPLKAPGANDNVTIPTGYQCILAIARLIGRRIAREEFEKRIAAANKRDKD